MARMVPTSGCGEWQVSACHLSPSLQSGLAGSDQAGEVGALGWPYSKNTIELREDLVYLAPASQDSEYALWSLQETGLKVNQPASFAVQLNGARGVIDARVHTPSGAVEECYVSELDSGELAPPLPSPARLESLAKG